MYLKQNRIILRQEDVKKAKKLTGTKIGACLGDNPYTSPFKVWLDITRVYKEPVLDNSHSKAGMVIEPKQADFIESLGNKVVRPSDLYGDRPYYSTHGDFFKDEIFGGMWDYLGDNKVYEMKTVSERKKEEWLNNGVPIYYKDQVALYCYLLKLTDYTLVATFLPQSAYQEPDKFQPNAYNTHEFNFKLTDKDIHNIEEAKDWYMKYVKTGISPLIETKEDIELANFLFHTKL